MSLTPRLIGLLLLGARCGAAAGGHGGAVFSAGAPAEASELDVRVFDNMALAGEPARTWRMVVERDGARGDAAALVLDLVSAGPLSAEVLGTMTLQGPLHFECSFAGADLAFVFVDDHLVCQMGAYTEPPAVSGVDNPVRKLSKAAVPFRAEVVASGGRASVRVHWRGDLPRVVPALPPAEVERRKLQRRLASGWGPWIHSTILKQAHLPSGAALTTALCRLQAQVAVDCQEVATPDDGRTRVGFLAYDGSFGNFAYPLGALVAEAPGSVRVAYSGGEELRILFTVEGVEEGQQGPARFAVAVFGHGAWKRLVGAARGPGATLSFSPPGLPGMTVHGVGADAALRLGNRTDETRPHFVLPLAPGKPVALAVVTVAESLQEVEDAVVSARRREEATYARFGALAEAKSAVQAAVMWNWIYCPAEAGPFAPVSRGWSFVDQPASPDWTYVIFEWDNIFASYMLGFDAKDLAYSNFIQVVRSKTADGFVPNFAAATRKSSDRTEPPIGALVLLELFRAHGDRWLVELLFDDLLDWHVWFLERRTGCGGAGSAAGKLICLGGDGMVGARLESGLDNSPMYDGDFYNASTHQMQLYDVGMTSLVAASTEALAELAGVLGRPEAAVLQICAEEIRAALAAELWDEDSGAFVNKFSQTGEFYRRVSPTSLYPLIAGAASDRQAEVMIGSWLMNRTRFCIARDGDMSGNSDDCYWGLPSISADDPAFPPLGYWRGFVWGPMAQLVYWGLRRYGHVPAARSARAALARQMTALVLGQWRRHGHICENFSPHRNSTECTGNRFYHWGALGAFISLLEQESWRGRPPKSTSPLGSSVQ